jgi:glycerol-3-phosphate dehydrogenase
MIRNIDRLTGRTFDLLVIGGGIYGLTIACDAAARGLAVALVEAADFGSGSSFNHLRTIHGGLRYLQSLDMARARESIRERRVLARIVPHAIRPLPFVLPLGQSLLNGSLAMHVGFLLDRLLGHGRNADVPKELHLPSGRVLGRDAALALCPDLPREGWHAAAVWHDYTTIEPDRLTLAWAIAADEHGAVLSNYVDAQSLIVDQGRVHGVRAIDGDSGRVLEIAARMTVNATGGQVDRLLADHGASTAMPLLKAMNLVTRRPASDPAVGGRARSGRHLFRVPWMGRAVFGTWESPRAAQSSDPEPHGDEVGAFIEELNSAFPALGLTQADVTLVHRGLVPAAPGKAGQVALEKHEQVCDHVTRHGIAGLISVAGTKYTTARAVAARVVDRVVAHLALPPVPSRTDITPLPGAGRSAPSGNTQSFALESRLSGDTQAHLAAAYGNRQQPVIDLAMREPAWCRRLADDSPVIAAELVHAVRHEMAVHLTDAVVRRTPLGALGFPGEPAAALAAAVVGEELGWSEERRQKEVAALRRLYVVIH